MKYGFYVRRYFLAFYWLLWALYTFDQGQIPGFWELFEYQGLAVRPYPWAVVREIWLILAISLAILYAILRPVTFDWSWRRLAVAIPYTLLIGFLAIGSGLISDMGGEAYVLPKFGVVTMIGVVGFAVILAIAALWRRFHQIRQIRL